MISEPLITEVSSFAAVIHLTTLCIYLARRCVEHAAESISGYTLVEIASTCSVKCVAILASITHTGGLLQSVLFDCVMDLRTKDESLTLTLFAEVQSIYHTADISHTRYITMASLYHTVRH